MSQFKNSQRAAALKYESDKPGSAPVVVAAGAGYTAQKIIEIAEQHNIPVYRDDSLATLLSQLEIGTEIPPELYQAIADIYIYFLNLVPDSQELSGSGAESQ
ncbi:MAG TPA: EscU/YscU/HrcU family type III secretion system export apparatus switch protein [Clostridiales bacterium]|nr:EscU/YscU/HrcU family type III secretion system export apparatus switch protein [Clostridiales bacterium]